MTTCRSVPDLQTHKATLVRLVQITDKGVQDRLVSFQAQMPSTALGCASAFRVWPACASRLGSNILHHKPLGTVLALQLAWHLFITDASTDRKEVEYA